MVEAIQLFSTGFNFKNKFNEQYVIETSYQIKLFADFVAQTVAEMPQKETLS
jgi:hypothetical protein